MRLKMIKCIPDFITILRFPLSMMFFFLLLMPKSMNANKFNIAICFILICITDLSDGFIAKRFKLETRFGAVLDLAADSFYVFISFMILNYENIIPIWFTFVVLLKLLDFIISSKIFAKSTHFIFDLPGKITVGGFYILPMAAGILSERVIILNMIVIFLTFAAVLSSVIRWKNLMIKE